MDLITSSSSGSENDMEEPRPRRRICRPRINFDRELDDFKAQFRLTRVAVERIMRDIGPRLQHDTDRNMPTTWF